MSFFGREGDVIIPAIEELILKIGLPLVDDNRCMECLFTGAFSGTYRDCFKQFPDEVWRSKIDIPCSPEVQFAEPRTLKP